MLCEDTDECAGVIGDGCRKHGVCDGFSSPGSFTCICDKGYTLNDKKDACVGQLRTNFCYTIADLTDWRNHGLDGSPSCCKMRPSNIGGTRDSHTQKHYNLPFKFSHLNILVSVISFSLVRNNSLFSV